MKLTREGFKERRVNMKILLIMFSIITMTMFLFANIEVNGYPTRNIITRAICSIISGSILTLMFGLPLLGVISLF